jgi:curved DNA-binding protein CbpA
MPADYYTALGVPQNATTEQVRKRFIELARKLHPDRFSGAAKVKAETDFQEITEAFNILSDPNRRREHDMELAQPRSAPTSGNDPKQLAKVYTQRGVKAYREKNFFEAADNFDRATKADPSNAKGWYHLALACSQQPRWLDRATAAIRRACELDEMNPSYFKLAGRLFARAKMESEAERYYNQALRWGGEDAAVRSALEALTAKTKKGGLPRIFGRKS